MAKFRPISKAAFEKAQARADRDPTPFAVDAHCNGDIMRIRLNTGAEIAFAPRLARGLENAHSQDLVDLAVEGGGTIIAIPKLDVYLSIGPLLEQFFGPMEWGRRERRAAASRENGRRGGRPPINKATKEEILDEAHC